MPSIRLPLLLLFAVTLAACSTARVSQFGSFADAGVKYADTVPAVFDQAFETSVKTDSLVLREVRPKLPDQGDRLNAITESNKNLVAKLEILSDLKAHAENLRAYFIALKALAASDSASGITQATKDLVGSLGKLDSEIMNARIGKAPINDFIGQAVPIAVAQFKSQALNTELKARAETIERELNLQEAALSAIAASMKSDLGDQFEAQDRDEIVLPYVRNGALPSDWDEKRLAAFRRRLDLAVIDAAVKAATNLRLSYIALAENRLDDSAIALVLSDLNKVVALLESVKGKEQPN